MVDSSQTRLAYIQESTWGTTPATPTFIEQRFTGESISPNIDTTVSNEIRADRNVTDLIQTGQSTGGSVDFELSYGSFDDWLESLMYSTWSTNVLKNGNTEKSFTLEKTFEAGATDQFHRYEGCIASGLDLSVQVDQIVTGSFEFVGKGTAVAQAAIAGSSYTGSNSNDVINANANFASLGITGVTSPELTGINLSITNNLRQQKALGSLDARGIGTGRFEVTGDLTAYFENEELFNLYLNSTATDLTFKLGGASSKNYVFNIGKLKFENAEVVAGGNDQDVLVTMGFRALFDGTDNTLEITRTA